MGKASAEFKVGLFVLIILVVLAFMTFRIGGFDWLKKDGYKVYLYSNDIAGLDRNAKVRIAGVDAGVIEDVRLEGNRAKLTLRMNPGVILYSDAGAAIKATGLLGDKYLAVTTGSRKPVLKEGDRIRNVEEVVNIGEMAKKLSNISDSVRTLTDNLNDIIGTRGSKKSIIAAIRGFKTITEKLNVAVSVNDRKLRATLDSFKRLTESLQKVVNENSRPLKDTIASLRDFSGALEKNGPELVNNIKDTTKSLKEISGKIERGEGTLGKLVQDDRLYKSVSSAAEGLGKTLSAIDRFRTFITFQGDYLARQGDGKGYFYVTLRPEKDKYYILGLVSDPLGRITTTKTVSTVNGVTTVEEKEVIKTKIEFTAQFARRFNNTAFRLGVTENAFGAGVDQFLLNDKLRLTSDIWDFGGNEENGGNPHLKIGAEYYFYRDLFLTAGYDDPFNSKRSSVYFGGGVKFEDEDFKYLFSSFSRVSAK
ncbi:mce related protein [bacterium BMS3Bbin05]|nr:mce related protein [bacterium BMS3Bbin05]HDL20064.1 MCE family protein [Nitrospirota bacterium]HDO21479.1 MCE family protein [Nitrospirota bacterium]